MTRSFVKSPMNYTGGKYKLLEQIIPLFPDNIDCFVDIFGGGGNVSVNVESKTVKWVDRDYPIWDFFINLQRSRLECVLHEFEDIITTYSLDKENKDGYLRLREDYNKNSNWLQFYMLIAHSFNNQIRFNQSGGFNSPFGKRTFNERMRQNFIDFHHRIKETDIAFMLADSLKFDLAKRIESDKDFVYADPPYLITCATYNEQGGWTEHSERELLGILDALNANSIRFALSNVLKHKGKSNEILIKWSSKYNVHYLSNNYSHSSYQTKDRQKDASTEVLITNY